MRGSCAVRLSNQARSPHSSSGSPFSTDPVAWLKAFILPGGTPKSAALHVARTVCRRAERSVVRLAREEGAPAEILVYLNRLSDLLFTLARLANHRAGVGDTTW